MSEHKVWIYLGGSDEPAANIMISDKDDIMAIADKIIARQIPDLANVSAAALGVYSSKPTATSKKFAADQEFHELNLQADSGKLKLWISYPSQGKAIGWKRELLREGVEPNPGPVWDDIINMLKASLKGTYDKCEEKLLEFQKTNDIDTSKEFIENIEKLDIKQAIKDEILKVVQALELGSSGPISFEDAIAYITTKFQIKPDFSGLLDTDVRDSFQERGTDVDNKIASWINFNSTSFREKKTQKQSYCFLYIINGSGIGKTWTGKRTSKVVEDIFPEDAVSFVYLDFTNGSKWGDMDNLEEAVSRSASLSLGIRMLAKMLFSLKPNVLVKDIPKNILRAFDFERVMSEIAKYKPANRTLRLVIQFDEMQTNHKYAQELLHVIAEYMCSTDAKIHSSSVVHQINVFPVITGTSSKGIKDRVTDYSNLQVHLKPFDWNTSVEYMENRIQGFSEDLENSAELTRLLKSCGGIPRILEFFSEPLLVGATDSSSILSSLMLQLEGAYKISDWVIKFESEENLRWVMNRSIIGCTVPYYSVLPSGILIEDLVKAGVVILSPTKNNEYNIVVPQILFHMVNMILKPPLVPDVNLVEPLSNVWNWKRFENFESHFEVIKNNLFINGGFEKTELGGFYYLDCRTQIQKSVVSLTYLADATEVNHWLPKTGSAKVEHKIETKEFGTILENDFHKYSFRCNPGNPSVDSRIFRLATDGKKPWLICKQTKHSIAESEMGLEYLEKCYEEFTERAKSYREHYRVLYVVITNRIVSHETIEELLERHAGISIIARHNLEEYLSLAFSSYSIFNDDADDDAMTQ